MNKAAHERLQITLAGVKQGAVSLWQRLQPYSFLLDAADGAFLQRMKERTDAEVERDTVRALGLSETLLSMMLEVTILASRARGMRWRLMCSSRPRKKYPLQTFSTPQIATHCVMTTATTARSGGPRNPGSFGLITTPELPRLAWDKE